MIPHLPSRLLPLLTAFGWALLTPGVASAQPLSINERIPDQQFFNEELDLQREELAQVRAAAQAGDYPKARAALAEYYRNRRIPVWKGAPEGLDMRGKDTRRFMEWGRDLLAGDVLEDWRTSDHSIDYYARTGDHFFPRMYWWSTLAQAYLVTKDPELAQAWVGFLRAFIEQAPPPPDGKPNYLWEGLKIGIRLRSGWPLAFHAFLDSKHFTDDDITRFLKSVIEQAEFAKRTHWPVGNKIAYAMVGLYSAGSAFPELTKASAWRQYAVEQALGNLDQGWLPDNMGVELSPGYHFAFKNYLTIFEIARITGRGGKPHMQQLVSESERLFELYPKLVAPDGSLPRFQDSGTVRIREQMEIALQYFPGNPLFQWFATNGEQGHRPHYRSIVLPYAGYAAMRTGWEDDATCVGFDVGPIGRGHAHQDKLNLVLWGYGRQLIIDPGHGDYGSGEFSRWALDTFSHNTALVDNRPQRREWGKSGGFMPTKPLTDYTFETQDGWDRASGVYDEAYGLPGPTESYPYGNREEFLAGWGHPAQHHRRVFFLHPDVILVADSLVPKDTLPHNYEIRWHIDSTSLQASGRNSGAFSTNDPGKPNLLIAPLNADGLSIDAVVAQETPPILGWNFHSPQPQPATTLRYRRSGQGTVEFVTLLLPERSGSNLEIAQLESPDHESYRFELSDGRTFEATVPANPARQLSLRQVDP